MVTVEGAYAIAAIVTTVVFGVGAVAGASVQIRCTDAAREAARLAAVGDRSARTTAAAMAGDGAQITLSDNGSRVVAEVRSDIPLLPMLEVSARAVAAKEPDDADVGISGTPATAAEPEDPP